jgi:hypothetical protein
MTTRGEGTMLICPLDFKQFSQGETKSLLDLVLDGLKDFMKQLKACEMKFKQPQNKVRLSLNPTPKNKGNRTRV